MQSLEVRRTRRGTAHCGRCNRRGASGRCNCCRTRGRCRCGGRGRCCASGRLCNGRGSRDRAWRTVRVRVRSRSCRRAFHRLGGRTNFLGFARSCGRARFGCRGCRETFGAFESLLAISFFSALDARRNQCRLRGLDRFRDRRCITAAAQRSRELSTRGRHAIRLRADLLEPSATAETDAAHQLREQAIRVR